MIEMAYQAPTPFPAFDTPEKGAAETYIGEQIHLCEQDALTCPIRQKYYEKSKNCCSRPRYSS